METQTQPTQELRAASCANGGPGTDDLTCPICLHAIDPMELAIVKGCFHEYCACCILKWAACKSGPDPAWCPQCKAPVNYLYLHRQLDGTLSDYPVEESVCLLKVATWFKEHVREADRGKLMSGFSAAEAGEETYDDDYDYDDDPEEEYYLTGSGRARNVVLGNRRLGQNGFMRSGRMYARPVPPAPVSRAKANNSNNKASSAASQTNSNPNARNSSTNRNNSSSGNSAPATLASGAGGSSVSTGSGSNEGGNVTGGGSVEAGPSASGAAPTSRGTANSSGAGPSSSTGVGSAKHQGRRAKRSQRRAAYDLAYDLDEDYY